MMGGTTPFDEDGGCLSLKVVRNSSWLRDFLPRLAELSPKEINDPAAATFCPACEGGPRGFVSYGGFQALLAHAGTVRTKRVRLHWRFAEILEAELWNRSTRAGEGDNVQTQAATDWKWLGLGDYCGSAGMARWEGRSSGNRSGGEHSSSAGKPRSDTSEDRRKRGGIDQSGTCGGLIGEYIDEGEMMADSEVSRCSLRTRARYISYGPLYRDGVPAIAGATPTTTATGVGRDGD